VTTHLQLIGIIIIVIIIMDFKMVFGIEKCKTLSIAKGKLEMRNFTTVDDDTVEAMKKDEIYRYLGHMQSKQTKHARMKQKLGEEYLHRTNSVLTFRRLT
jgi:hypothetical protein